MMNAVRPSVVLVAALLTLLCGLWVREAEIVVITCQVTESVPAVPAVAVLLLLLAALPLLRRLRCGRREILVIYAFVVIAISVPGCSVLRFLLALLPASIYYATPENKYDIVHPHLKPWLVPKDFEVVRQLYESSPDGKVPWGAWAVPLLMWSLFFLMLWLTLLCLVTLFRRQWTDKERLTFPLLYLPMEMAGVGESGQASLSRFFRNPVMWVGFGLAAFYNLLNMLNAFNPAVACPGKFFDAGALFTERPLDALRPFVLHYRPDLVGFGFLVSTEISFSIWVSYLFEKFIAIGGRVVGYEVSGYPFPQEQSLGAYLCLAMFLIWAARKPIVNGLWLMVPGAWRKSTVDRSDTPPRWAFFGLLAGMGALCAFCRLAGMATWVALVYLLIVLAVALVYVRIRAETGVPLIWMFPYYMQKKVLLYTLGSAPFMPGGDLSTLTTFALLTFLSRGYFPALAAYQLENLKLADVAGIKTRSMAAVIVLALLVGLGVGFYFHLTPYYYYGAGTLRGGIWGTGLAVQEFQDIVNFTKTPKPPDVPRIAATGFGFVVAGVLAVLRMVFLRFPLHPLGFGMATAYGDLIWWSFFLVWCIKAIVLKIGGVKLYKQLVPGFLGFALGHFFMAGMVWGLFSITGLITEEVFRRYAVWFG
ncbi:MAG: hypothetical protein NZT92_07300 [Abditibacteriales bacterium]|nr:hypothetical protein [Abditibacteriales bacterium]MDW8365790.1 DUF6785 family protein [Abditibacteriales bacterium]